MSATRARSARPDGASGGPHRAPEGPHRAPEGIVPHEQLIESTANPRIKAVVRLRERRERDSSGLTVVDGVREIRRALRCRARIEVAYVGPSAERGDGVALAAELREAAVPLVRVGPTVEARLAFGDRAEGIVAVVRPPARDLASLRLPADPLLVVLERVEKPGNLGAVLRSVDGAGADALIAADPLADVWSPNAIRASVGTIFAVPTAAAGTDEVIEWCLSRSIRLVAARVDAPTLHTEADLTGGIAIVLGSEAAGLGRAWDRPEVEAVRLPMLGIADSLNVSAAAAVLLYEARRQRDAAGGGSDASPRHGGAGSASQ